MEGLHFWMVSLPFHVCHQATCKLKCRSKRPRAGLETPVRGVEMCRGFDLSTAPLPAFHQVMYPSYVASGQGLVVVNRYRFIFERFRASRYFFGVLYLVRTDDWLKHGTY